MPEDEPGLTRGTAEPFSDADIFELNWFHVRTTRSVGKRGPRVGRRLGKEREIQGDTGAPTPIPSSITLRHVVGCGLVTLICIIKDRKKDRRKEREEEEMKIKGGNL
jgi:hypothetical protein